MNFKNLHSLVSLEIEERAVFESLLLEILDDTLSLFYKNYQPRMHIKLSF